jgi:hypothetical protein
MAGTQLIRPQLKAWTQALVDLGSISGTATVNFTVGNFQKITAAGAVTLALSGWPSVGTAGGYGAVRVWIVIGDYTTQTLQLPASVSIGVNTIAGYNSSNNTITFDANGNYIFDFSSIDGGSTYFIDDLMRNRNNGSFTTITSAGLQAKAIGNVTPGTGAFTTVTTAGLQSTAIGNVAPGTGVFSTLTSSGNLFVANTYVPTFANSGGAAGQISFNSSFVYICLGANNWKRANIAAW